AREPDDSAREPDGAAHDNDPHHDGAPADITEAARLLGASESDAAIETEPDEVSGVADFGGAAPEDEPVAGAALGAEPDEQPREAGGAEAEPEAEAEEDPVEALRQQLRAQ